MKIDTIRNRSRRNPTASKNESPKKSQSRPNRESSDSGKSKTKDTVKLDPESKQPEGDDKRVGSILGGLAESLGKGGKGEAYLAEDTRLKCEVANLMRNIRQ